MDRMVISSGSPWESQVGYSRAVRVGQTVYIAGTTSTDKNGDVIGEGDPYEQTIQIYKKMERVMISAGGGLRHVVRTRVYLTNIDDWQEVGRAHKELMGNIMPAMTLVEVSKLIDPKILVEIEAEAYINE